MKQSLGSKNGSQIIGGCCGVGPDLIKGLSELKLNKTEDIFNKAKMKFKNYGIIKMNFLTLLNFQTI